MVLQGTRRFWRTKHGFRRQIMVLGSIDEIKGKQNRHFAGGYKLNNANEE